MKFWIRKITTKDYPNIFSNRLLGATSLIIKNIARSFIIKYHEGKVKEKFSKYFDIFSQIIVPGYGTCDYIQPWERYQNIGRTFAFVFPRGIYHAMNFLAILLIITSKTTVKEWCSTG